MRVLLAVASFGIMGLATSAAAIDMCGSGPRVNCVVDGDTFWLDGQKYRAFGYDTPEPQTNICGGDVERQLASQASRRFMELLNTTEITLEPRGEDRYGRILVVIRSDGEDIADILVREGLARYYPDGEEFWCH
ncbi:thermonuclease family protein [Nioella aestuarii]|uniref:thermonuclease family protein n=1 Tax=Nioella aestuarii TaxID=1662864 RepID=UPI003D7F6544